MLIGLAAGVSWGILSAIIPHRDDVSKCVNNFKLLIDSTNNKRNTFLKTLFMIIMLQLANAVNVSLYIPIN